MISPPPPADTACRLQGCSGTWVADLDICSRQVNTYTNKAEVMSRKKFVCVLTSRAQTTYDIQAYTTGTAIQNTAGCETFPEAAAALLLQPNIKAAQQKYA